MNTEISPGLNNVHKIPSDLRDTLASDQKALEKWNDLTTLARNEWICWVISVTLPETRAHHIKRLRAELKEGKRRPCCWYGCPHRPDKAVSPSVRSVLNRRHK